MSKAEKKAKAAAKAAGKWVLTLTLFDDTVELTHLRQLRGGSTDWAPDHERPKHHRDDFQEDERPKNHRDESQEDEEKQEDGDYGAVSCEDR